MATITYILRDGSRRNVDAPVGTTVMQAAIRYNIRGIEAECGGSMSCATCHVYVDDAFFDRLPAAEATESELLEGVAAERRRTSRLGCQMVVTADLDGLIVRVPERQA